jgi:hypothetical protein
MRDFYISGERLLYAKKDEPKVRGVIDLSFSYLICINPNTPDLNDSNLYKIIIEKSKRYTSIFVKDSVDLKIWLEELSRYTIRTDFHQVFQAEKKLGEGAFGAVFLVTRKSDGV